MPDSRPRDKSLFLAHFFVAAILGVFCGRLRPSHVVGWLNCRQTGGLYFHTGISIAGFQSRVGCLFFLVRISADDHLRAFLLGVIGVIDLVHVLECLVQCGGSEVAVSTRTQWGILQACNYPAPHQTLD